jgi:hypothetical protein
MSEANDITDRPRAAPPRDEEEAPPEKPKSRAWLYVLGCGLVSVLLCCPLSAVGVGIGVMAIQKVREAAARAQSQNNLRQMGIAMNNIAGDTPARAQIPPSLGTFPEGKDGKNGSFFVHLLPYLDAGAYGNPSLSAPVKTYIAPADARNPGLDATISYASNATVLGVNPPTPPRLTTSFGGRTSTVIAVMERSGLNGAHKWNSGTTWLGGPNSPPPLPQFDADPSAYQEGSPQAFNSGGCMVGLGDASARPVTKSVTQSVWNSLCNPQAPPPPPDW